MTASLPIGQPVPFRMLIDDAMKLARRHFRAIYLPVAVPLAVMAAVQVVAQVKWMAWAQSPRTDVAPFLVRFMLPMILILLVYLLIYVLAYIAMLVAATDAVMGRAIDMKRAWRFPFQWRVQGTLLRAGVLIFLSFLLLFFPGLYVSLLYSFIVPVMVEENTFGSAALRRSSRLVKYNPRRRFVDNPMVKVFAIFFLGWILAYAVSMVVQIPLIITQQVLMFRSIAEGQAMEPGALMERLLWLQVPSNVLGVLAYTAVNLYTSVCLVLFFVDVRRRKEGRDIEAALAEFAGMPAVDPYRPPPIG
ncbi:MAG: hypothetical protein AB1714_19930 [Acidobacteriota bacterium]